MFCDLWFMGVLGNVVLLAAHFTVIFSPPNLSSLCRCMHDEASPSYVDMLDQTALGHRLIKEQFGGAAVPRATWQMCVVVWGCALILRKRHACRCTFNSCSC